MSQCISFVKSIKQRTENRVLSVEVEALIFHSLAGYMLLPLSKKKTWRAASFSLGSYLHTSCVKILVGSVILKSLCVVVDNNIMTRFVPTLSDANYSLTYHKNHFSFISAIALVRMTVKLSSLEAIKPFKHRKEWL